MSELSESIPLPLRPLLEGAGDSSPLAAAVEGPGPGLGKDDNYRQFADEIALKHRDLHARLTYSIHWLYREIKTGR